MAGSASEGVSGGGRGSVLSPWSRVSPRSTSGLCAASPWGAPGSDTAVHTEGGSPACCSGQSSAPGVRCDAGDRPGTHPSSPLLCACVLVLAHSLTPAHVCMLAHSCLNAHAHALHSALTLHADPCTLAHAQHMCLLMRLHTHVCTLTLCFARSHSWSHTHTSTMDSRVALVSGAPRAPANQHPGQ